MKSIIAAGSLILAAAAMPAVAVAQTTMTASAIIVTGKHKDSWERGSRLEAQGLNELERAKRNLVRHSADVVDAQNKRDSARSRAENASADFRRLTSSMSHFADADDAARWARDVERAARQWARQDDRRGDGRKELDRAIKRQANAQAAVDRAQAKVDRGRTMKVEAERLSMLSARN